jgi:hypothetical protein
MNKPLFDNRQGADGHPDFARHAFGQAAERDADVKAALDNALSYLELTYKTTQTLHEAEPTVKGLRMEAEFLTAAERVYANIEKSFETRAAALQTARQKVEAKIAAVLQDPNAAKNAALYSEIRSHIARQPQGERSKFVTTAIAEADKATLNAVLGAPAYLSGLDAKQQATYRTMAAHRWATADVASLKAIDSIIARVQRTHEQATARIAKTRTRYASDRPAKLKLLDSLGSPS